MSKTLYSLHKHPLFIITIILHFPPFILSIFTILFLQLFSLSFFFSFLIHTFIESCFSPLFQNKYNGPEESISI